MGVAFTDAIAETRQAFLDLVRDTSATFYEVYSGIPARELEGVFDTGHQGEVFLRFDVQKHSDEARGRFCQLGDLERRAYALPATLSEKPMPYFGAFVPGIGHTGIAWTSDEIRELIARTRQDEVRAKCVAEQTGKGKAC
jgi:hypothetical protein